MQKRKASVFYKYIISSILIIAVPFGIFGVFIYQKLVLDLKNEIEKTSMVKLNQMSDLMESRFNELSRIGDKISMDADLTPYRFHANEAETMRAMKELGKYRNNGIVEDIFLYFLKDNNIYSSSGANTLEVMTQNSYKCSGWNINELYQELNESKIPHVKSNESSIMADNDSQRLISYIYPLRNSGGFRYGTALFLVKETVITSMLSNMLASHDGCVFITDDKGNLLISFNKNLNISYSDFKKVKDGYSTSAIYSFNYKGESHSLSHTISSYRGLNFYMLIPSKQLYANFNQSKMLVIEIILLALSIAVFLSILVSRSNYNPIKALSETLGNLLPKDRETNHRVLSGRSGNEIDMIRYAIENAATHVNELNTQLQVQEMRNKENHLIKLIKGNAESPEELEECMSGAKIDTTCSQYFALAISFTSKPLITREAIIFFLEEIISSTNNKCYTADMPRENMIAMVIGVCADGDGNQCVLPTELISLLQDKIGTEVLIGVGREYSSAERIPNSYMEAAIALSRKSDQNDSAVITYQNIISTQASDLWFPNEQLLILEQYLLQGDEQKAVIMVGNLIQTVKSKNYLKGIEKCIFYEIVNTLIKLAVKKNINLYPDEIDRLVGYKSLDKLEENLYSFIKRVCYEFDKVMDNKSKEITDSIIKFVDENYKDLNFSLETLAIQFNLSLSYLSIFFKESTGQTFTDYIAKLRIEEFMHQLINTDLPIKQIVHDIGYIDESNFIRKFRNLKGITPGEYRKIFRTSNADI